MSEADRQTDRRTDGQRHGEVGQASFKSTRSARANLNLNVKTRSTFEPKLHQVDLLRSRLVGQQVVQQAVGLRHLDMGRVRHS